MCGCLQQQQQANSDGGALDMSFGGLAAAFGMQGGDFMNQVSVVGAVWRVVCVAWEARACGWMMFAASGGSDRGGSSGVVWPVSSLPHP
jgi:hypothetical protein